MASERNEKGRNRAALLAVCLLSSGLVACGGSDAPDCGGLKVADAWVRTAPAGADVMGAYLSLVNAGDTRVVINGVSSSQFDRVEMHETVTNDDGQTSMQPLEKVAVPAGETADFKPGQRHIMLFAPGQDYAAGDQVELILACGSRNAERPVAATVRAAAPGMDMSGGMPGMDHGSMPDGGDSNSSEKTQNDDDNGAAAGSAL